MSKGCGENPSGFSTLALLEDGQASPLALYYFIASRQGVSRIAASYFGEVIDHLLPSSFESNVLGVKEISSPPAVLVRKSHTFPCLRISVPILPDRLLLCKEPVFSLEKRKVLRHFQQLETGCFSRKQKEPVPAKSRQPIFELV